jgi:hypothetical protein
MPILIRFLIFVIVALATGLGSAGLLLDKGFFATARQMGPWSIWMNSGSLDADPYSLARTARSGLLPITSGSLLSFSATTDSKGRRLNGACTYEVLGRPFPALWWDIAAFDVNGGVIPNEAGRHAFNSTNLFIRSDGRFTIQTSPEVRPGNWLPTADGENFVLYVNILRPYSRDRFLNSPAPEEFMPRITKVKC